MSLLEPRNILLGSKCRAAHTGYVQKSTFMGECEPKVLPSEGRPVLDSGSKCEASKNKWDLWSFPGEVQFVSGQRVQYEPDPSEGRFGN